MIFINHFTPSNFQIFKLILESLLSTPMSQNGVWKDGMIDLESGRAWTTSTQENDWSQVKVQQSKFVQEVGPNQEVETQVYIYFPTMECDFLRLVIQVLEWQVWESKLTLKYYSNQVAK